MSDLTITQPAANVLEISNEQPAFAGLAYVQSFATSNTVMTTAFQVYDIGTLTLPAGTWLITGQTALVQGASAGASQLTMFLYNNTTPAYLSTTTAHKTSVSSTSAGLNCSIIAVLTVSTVVTMKAKSSIAAYSAIYTNGTEDNVTGMHAVRISA
jgi:hypothetical protein